jgi:hypothetical protein
MQTKHSLSSISADYLDVNLERYGIKLKVELVEKHQNLKI